MQHTLDFYRKTLQVAVLEGMNVKPRVRRLTAHHYAHPAKRDLSRQTQIQGSGLWETVRKNNLVRYCYRVASIIKTRSGLVDCKSDVPADNVYVAKDQTPLTKKVYQGY